jgi:hypothetical protein
LLFKSLSPFPYIPFFRSSEYFPVGSPTSGLYIQIDLFDLNPPCAIRPSGEYPHGTQTVERTVLGFGNSLAIT